MIYEKHYASEIFLNLFLFNFYTKPCRNRYTMYNIEYMDIHLLKYLYLYGYPKVTLLAVPFTITVHLHTYLYLPLLCIHICM